MRMVLYVLQLPVSLCCLHFKWSPFLSISLLLRETDFIMCFNEAIKNFNHEIPLLPLYVSVSLSELHCDISYMAAYIDVLSFPSRLDNPPAIITCFNRKFSTHVFLSWVPARFDFCRSRILMGMPCFLLFLLVNGEKFKSDSLKLYTHTKRTTWTMPAYTCPSLQELRNISEV